MKFLETEGREASLALGALISHIRSLFLPRTDLTLLDCRYLVPEFASWAVEVLMGVEGIHAAEFNLARNAVELEVVVKSVGDGGRDNGWRDTGG